MVLLLVFMQLTRDLFAIAKFLFTTQMMDLWLSSGTPVELNVVLRDSTHNQHGAVN